VEDLEAVSLSPRIWTRVCPTAGEAVALDLSVGFEAVELLRAGSVEGVGQENH
jgi:hypothetical protein